MTLSLCFKKELGDKIIGNYPSKNYGRLSILTNFKFDIMNKFLVSPNCFVPRPKGNFNGNSFLNLKPKSYLILKM